MARYLLLIGLLVVVGVTGCSTKVIRKDPADVVDFSGRWNDTDARMTAEEMIRACTSAPWVGLFNKEKGRDPVVIVGSVLNRTHEHIETSVFVKDLEHSLINSGKVRFVADSSTRTEVRTERQDQQVNAREETRARLIQETGADFMLQGTVNSVKDETRGKYAILFQANLELVDLSTNEKVWSGQEKIKKVVKNPKYSM